MSDNKSSKEIDVAENMVKRRSAGARVLAGRQETISITESDTKRRGRVAASTKYVVLKRKTPPTARVNNDIFVAWHQAPLIDRVDLIKRGVNARMVGEIAQQLDMANTRLMKVLGMSAATVNRKAKANDVLSVEEGSRVVGVGRLIGQVTEMVQQSGDPKGFDAAKWVADWIEHPVPALGNRKPSEFLDTIEGQQLVSQIVARMQSGAYS
jgi:putative toxin-antitoxin system antitoxin component (TIGR02293 family)